MYRQRGISFARSTGGQRPGKLRKKLKIEDSWIRGEEMQVVHY
jgi:hypothetical protein